MLSGAVLAEIKMINFIVPQEYLMFMIGYKILYYLFLKYIL